MTRPHVHTAKRKHPSVAGSDSVGLRAKAHLAAPARSRFRRRALMSALSTRLNVRQ